MPATDYTPTTDWWLSGTPLEAEHQRLMRRRRVPIPWDETTAGELTEPERARLGETWIKRSEAEYLAVSTFAILAIDLCAAGAPADVLSLCHRAAIDEVRHAELCIRMAEIYTGDKRLPPAGMSNLPDDPERPRRAQAVANALLVSSVAETYATTILAAARDQTTDPTAREVMTSIYSDEVMHARLGWSYLRYAIDRWGDQAREAAGEMVPVAVRGVANVVETPRRNDPLSDGLRAHGMMLPAEERALFAECVDEVIAPGFEALGIDVADIRERYDAAWAAQPPPEPEADSEAVTSFAPVPREV